jgi:cytochrome c peroxidase
MHENEWSNPAIQHAALESGATDMLGTGSLRCNLLSTDLFKISDLTRSKTSVLVTCLALLFVCFGYCAAFAQDKKTAPVSTDNSSPWPPSEVPSPVGNKPTPERIELGKMLFFDPRLSGSRWISCATCHNPSLGWSDGLPTAVGDGWRDLPRKTPTIVNCGFNTIQMWDGRIGSLEEQVWVPILGPVEMHGSEDHILLILKALPGYVDAFHKAYPGEEIGKDTIGKAIASFERTLISKDSPFDRWQQGDESAMTPSAKRGFTLFSGRANCIACHQGGNFTDQGFHNIGLKDTTDPGRFAIVPIRIVRGAFKTPTLRDVALTAPYMHNGSYRTLEEVIDLYDRGGDDHQNLDPNIKPLGLTDQEKKDLLEFLKSLTGKPLPIVAPRLPQAF